MTKCRITVMKKMINRDLINENCSLDLSDMCLGCHLFAVGEEFIVENHTEIPKGFCSWAWGDIQKDVTTIMFDGSFPWIKQTGLAIACCSNGLMPVVFKIEKISQQSS